MTLPWYPRDMGKYARDTKHLTMLEHGAYSQLLDYYYSTGGLPQAMVSNAGSNAGSNAQLMPDHSRIYRVCGASTKHEQDAVDSVLKFFFVIDKRGFYINEKCQEVIETQSKKHQNRSRIGRENRAKAMLKQCSSSTPQTQTKTKKESLGAFEKDSGEKKTAFNIEHILTEREVKEAKAAAPGWDIYYLMREYSERINGGSFGIPRLPAKAFTAWCAAFTKGKAP